MFFLLLSLVFSAAVAAVSIRLYFSYTSPIADFGIVAIFPASLIITGVLHLGTAIVGGVIGTI